MTAQSWCRTSNQRLGVIRVFAGCPCPSWVPQPMVPPTHLCPFKLFEVQVIANPPQISFKHEENLLSQLIENPKVGLASDKVYPGGSISRRIQLPAISPLYFARCLLHPPPAVLRVKGGCSSAWSLSLVKALGRETISPGSVLRRACSVFLRRPSQCFRRRAGLRGSCAHPEPMTMARLRLSSPGAHPWS